MTESKKCLVGTSQHSGDRLVIVTFDTEAECHKHMEQHKETLDAHWKNVKICNHPYKEKRHAQDRQSPNA